MLGAAGRLLYQLLCQLGSCEAQLVSCGVGDSVSWSGVRVSCWVTGVRVKSAVQLLSQIFGQLCTWVQLLGQLSVQ